MPHFLIHTTSQTIPAEKEETFLKAVQETAMASGLFAEQDIKVRVVPFDRSMVGGKMGAPFVHVFAYIMEGRTTQQKQALSEAMVRRLKELLPDVPALAMNVSDFEKATYFNGAMI